MKPEHEEQLIAYGEVTDFDLVCPYCGTDDTDNQEELEMDGVAICGECDRLYRYEVIEVVSYVTRRKE